jgi:hypothetical protein
LHSAAMYGYLAIAKRLLEGGADPTLRAMHGKTALDYARERGYSEVVALLSEPRYAARACTLIAHRCRADVQRRRLGRTRTTGFRPLGERMAANRHGMRPRGRRAPPMGPHGESRSHILKILGRSPHGPLPRAVVGTSGVGGGLAAWFATRRGCDWPRRPRHTLLPLPLTALPSSRPPFASPRAS